jgi:hypothetical protein
VDPLIIYILMFVMAVSLCLSAVITGTGPTRKCPQCDRRVPITARKCRGCLYRFTV